MHVGHNGDVSEAKATKAEAIIAQLGDDPAGCSLCGLEGHVTIFHDEYGGLPTRTIETRGEVREALACCIAHCRCEVGKWMRAHSEADVLKRVPPVSAVGIGKLQNWSTLDPSLPDFIPGDEVDWKAARARFAQMGRRVVEKVYPKSDGNRVSAYREMAEPLPGSRPVVEESPVPF